MIRDMEMDGILEENLATDVDASAAPRQSLERRRALAVGSALSAAVAVACAIALLLLGRTNPNISVETAPFADGLVLANAQHGDSEFPYGFHIVHVCGIDYQIEEVVHNNLGGQGPDTGAEGIKYRCRMMDNGKFVRHIMVSLNAKNQYASQSSHMNGMQHGFGAIHVEAGQQVDLHVSFHDMEGEPLELKTFRMTFYDLDEAPGGLSQEYIIAQGHPASQRNGKTTDVAEHKVHGGVMFEATQVGSGADNPDDPGDLSHLQEDRSVVLTYHDIKDLDLSIGSRSGHSPRAFEFALQSALSCHEVKVPITTTATTTSTTTTTIDPEIIAAQQRDLLTKILAAIGTLAAIAAITGFVLWLAGRERREIAYFEGTS